jgi:hypothetical protein
MKKVRRRDAIRSAVPGVWSACGAQALSGCPHGARDARRARSPRGHGARSGGLLRQRRRTRPVGSCGEPRRTTQRAVDTAVEALAPRGAEDGRLSRGPAKVAACSGRGRIRCRLEGSVPRGSLCHLVLLTCGGQPDRSFNRPSQPISASGPACPSRSGGNRTALGRFHGGDGDKPDLLCHVWSCLLVAKSLPRPNGGFM